MLQIHAHHCYADKVILAVYILINNFSKIDLKIDCLVQSWPYMQP